jgi:hypothetical protein
MTSAAMAESSQEEADRLAKKGIELRRAGDDLGALPLFQRAHQIAPTPRSAVQLGTVEQALGHWVEAEEHLAQGRRNASDPWIEKYRGQIDGSIQDVKRHVASVEVKGDPPGAEVLVNGRSVGKLPLANAIRVNAGSVDVEVNAAGHQRGFRTITVGPTEFQTVVLRLERIQGAGPPPPPPTEAGTPWQRWAAIGVFAGGAVFAGMGTYGVIRHNDRVESFNGKCAEGPMGALDKGTGQPSGACADLQSQYQGARTLTIVGYSVAGALVAAGVVLLLTTPDQPQAESRLSLSCGPSLGVLGAACAGRF